MGPIPRRRDTEGDRRTAEQLVLVERGASGRKVLRYLTAEGFDPATSLVLREDHPDDALAKSAYSVDPGQEFLASESEDARLFATAAGLVAELRARAADWSPHAFEVDRIDLLGCIELDLEAGVIFPALRDFGAIVDLAGRCKGPIRIFRTGLGNYDPIVTAGGFDTIRTRLRAFDPFSSGSLYALYNRRVPSVFDQPLLDIRDRRQRRESRRRVEIDPRQATHVFVIPFQQRPIFWDTARPVMTDLARDCNVVLFSDGSLSYPVDELERASCTFLSITGELRLRDLSGVVGRILRVSHNVRKFRREVLSAWIEESSPAARVAVRQVDRYLTRQLSRAVLWAKVWTRYLTDTMPSTVVVVPDRKPFTRVPVSAAKVLGIPSINIQNSMMSDSPRYGPQHTTAAAVMDTYQKSILTGRGGIDPGRVFVTGQPRWDDSFKLPTDEKLPPPDYHGTHRQVVVATQPLFRRVSEPLVRAVVGALDAHPDVRLILKVHPRETTEPYESLAESLAPARVAIEVVRDVDLHDLIIDSHLLITGFSLVGIEAALLDRPVITVSFGGEWTTLPWAQMGIAVHATNEVELASAVSGVLYDQEYRDRVEGLRRSFLTANPQYTDGLAAHRTAELVRGLAVSGHAATTT